MKVSDTEEGRTLFIRNLSFDTDEEKLHNFFSQFGSLLFAKVVKDPSTQHSRGSAFVKFVDSNDVQNLLNDYNSGNTHHFVLDNRNLCLSLAVSRVQANDLRKVKKALSTSDTEENVSNNLSVVDEMKQKGRNLHLARVGIIRPGTPAAEGMSKEDLLKRQKFLQKKKEKLKDHNYFISDCRLLVRNLPLDVSDDDLRKICFNLLHAFTKTVKIKECRVMRNLKPGRQQNRSLGYAFVTLDTHSNAMQLLESMDNNPHIFPKHRRPVVEFSVENMNALRLKDRRMQKAKLMQMKASWASSSGTSESPMTNQQSGVRINKVNRRQSIQKSRDLTGGTKTRVFPKRLGAKKRFRNRGLSSSSSVKKQKNQGNKKSQRVSRKQKLLRKAEQR